MDQIQKKPQLSILILLLTFANVLGVLYSAALPNLTTYFQISKFQAQETISIYLVGCLLGQIIYAPLANAFGRKPALYIGGSLTALGSLLCLFAIEIEAFSLLLFGRGLTAFGASCGLVLTNTLLTDAFTFAQIKKILSYFMCGFAVFPAISIAVGGVITNYFSWKGCFYFMLTYSLCVLGLCLLLPETAKDKSLAHLKVTTIAKSYLKQLRNIQFLLYAGIVAFSSLILYIFSAEAPFIATNQLHISASRFGLYNLIPSIGLLLGGIISGQISQKLSSKTFLLIGSSFFLLFSLIMWLFFEIKLINIFTLFGMPLFIFFTAPTVISHSQALTMAASEDRAYASSVMYMIQYGCMFLSIASLGLFSPKNAAALPIIYSVSGILMLVFWSVIKMLRSDRSSA